MQKWSRHDYFLWRPKAGRLSLKSVPLSRSGPCGSVGWCSKGCTRTLTIYGVARGLVGGPGVPKSCTRTLTLAGWCSRCCADGWCSKSWGGVPKSCPRIPTARWVGVPKVGVVLQKVVPESPWLDGMVFQKLGWCSKKLSQNPNSVYYYYSFSNNLILCYDYQP